MEKEDKRTEWGRKCSQGKSKYTSAKIYIRVIPHARPGCLIPQRVVVALMGFLALMFAYTNRVSISHVITELVVPKSRVSVNGTSTGVCPGEAKVTSTGEADVSGRNFCYLLVHF